MTVLIHTSKRPRAWCPDAPELPRRWMAALPPGKRAALRSLRSAADRWDSLVGLRLLERGMATAGVLDFDPARLRFGRALKPRWERCSGASLDFSISHAGGLVACAIDLRPGHAVGIDVEPLRPVDADRLGGYLTQAERRRVTSARDLLELWTRKESVVKAAGGEGLAKIPLVELDTADPRRARLGAELWCTTALELAPGFAASLATSDGAPGVPEVEVRHVPWAELLREAREAEPVP